MIIYALIALALVYALRQIIVKSSLYLHGIYGPDATLYWTMGNAIRNGLTMYLDIFEPKPPGIFLLGAASFELFGDGTLGNVLSMLILLGTPLLFVFWAASYAKGRHPASLLLFGLATGLTLALYNSTIGGDWQTEYYGAFFGLLYVYSIDRWQRRPSPIWMASACIAFAFALLLKETLLPALTAAAILLLRSRREWIWLWLMPGICGGVLFLFVLVAVGALDGYVTIYLPGILGNYVVRGPPVWARGVLAWESTYGNVKDFSPLFPLYIAALFIAALPAAETMRERRFRWAAALSALGVMMTARSFAPVDLAWKTNIVISLVVAVLGLSILSRVATLKTIPRMIGRIGLPILALYLVLTSIALGPVFHGQYFAIAIPFYAALVVLVQRKSTRPLALMGLTLLSAVTLVTSTPFASTDKSIVEQSIHRAAAARLDAILDACDVDRYYFLEGRGLIPYTKHSPLNFYVYTRIEHLPRYHPVFLEPSMRNLQRTAIMVNSEPYVAHPRAGVAAEERIGTDVEAFVRNTFTSDPWPCARNLPAPEGYEVLYRKDFPLQSAHGVDLPGRTGV